MVISRRWAWFLVGVGVWTWAIWPRFAVAIWNDQRAWSSGQVGHGAPTGFLWIHALLIAASLAIGTAVGILGIRALRARRLANAALPSAAVPSDLGTADVPGHTHGS